MNAKIALAAFAAATLVVGPALAEGEATTTTTTTATASAGEAKGGEKGGEREFGNPGVINIGGTVPFFTANETEAEIADSPTGFGFEQKSTKAPSALGGASTSSTSFSLSPTLDYFVAEGISVGGFVGFGYRKFGEDPKKTTITTYGVGPRVGYNLWLSPGKLSLWPNVWFGYFGGSVKVGDGDSVSVSKMTIGLNVPFLIHPVQHFHFGIGPFVKLDVASKVKSEDSFKDTTFGLAAEIAGWL